MNHKQPTTNNEQRTNKAFTLFELVVSIALLSIIFLFAGKIFRVSINAYRVAAANADIMQKFRAITDQLNADFKGLRKDGEIFVVWVARGLDASAAQYDNYRDCDNDGYERFDRIMFFADGDFQSYGTNPKLLHGNTARICYMLARDGSGIGPEDYNDVSLTERGRKSREEKRRGRILSRTQHILTADSAFNGFQDIRTFASNDPRWDEWNNSIEYEYYVNSLDKWENIPWSNKKDMLSVIADVIVDLSTVPEGRKGTKVDSADPNTIHNLLCEGVGEFKVQGWYHLRKRWVAEVDPNGDGILTNDSDFPLQGNSVDPCSVPGVLYTTAPYGGAIIYDYDNDINYPSKFDEAHFNEIPGLGRALKFTFTLYDSKGIIKNGRTFTHFIYLDN